MAEFKVLGGDFNKGRATLTWGSISFAPEGFSFTGERRSNSELDEVAIATEETFKRLGGTLGWGAVGAVALGPVGLLAGLLLGGSKKEVTFVARYKDGKKFLAVGDPKIFQKCLAASMTKGASSAS
jgi:hypothetical protein